MFFGQSDSHLLKTFGGWRNRQLPDGSVIWTSPSGDTYVTTPGRALLFPSLCAPTGALPAPAAALRCIDPTTRVPKRRHTRAQNQAMRVAAERRLNRQHREAELGKQRWEQVLAMATGRCRTAPTSTGPGHPFMRFTALLPGEFSYPCTGPTNTCAMATPVAVTACSSPPASALGWRWQRLSSWSPPQHGWARAVGRPSTPSPAVHRKLLFSPSAHR